MERERREVICLGVLARIASDRGAVLRHGAALSCFVMIALWVSPSSLARIVLTAAFYGAYAITDARRRHMSDRTA